MICADGRVVAQRGIVVSKLSADRIFVGDSDGTGFDFTGGGKPLTALPAILTALNATYTRNSTKNVVQNGALVSLSANQFGTSYDPVAAQYGYVPEPAATNLCTNSDGNASTYTVSNVSDGTAVPGFTNGLAFGNNSVQRSATKSISVTSGTAYSISFFVIMDDGNAPVVGTTNSTGDFSITLNATIATTKLERLIGSNVYRVSASITAGATSSQAAGIIKYTGQSARTFRITGIQVETGLRATSYIATTGSTASRSADVLTVPLWINNVKDSQDGSTSNWTRTNCTVATSGTSPNGSAQQVTASSTASTQFYASALSPAKNLLTVSVWVKAGNLATCKVLVRNNTNATDFTTGTLTYGTGVITGSGWTATDLGSGWFKCVYKTVTNGDGVSVGDTIRVYVGFVSGTYTSGDNFYFGGAQIEAGSVATTYRPTTSTLESAANANIAGFSSAGYTLAVDTRSDVVLSGLNVGLHVNDGTVNNRAMVYQNTTSKAISLVVSGGSTVATLTMAGRATTRSKFSSSNKADLFLIAADGVAGSNDTAGGMPSTPLFLNIGVDQAGTGQFNGFLFRGQLITQAFTQAQINGLTQ